MIKGRQLMSDSSAARARSDGETTGSEQREARTLTGATQDFDLQAEIASLKLEPAWQQSDRNSRTLVHESKLRIIVTVMKAGAQLREHRTDGAVSIQTIEGHLRLGTERGMIDLEQGRLVAIDSDVPHELEAVAESAFILTVAWPAGKA
jgi:quercetin dioxygenase-like cupin family protein